MGEGALTGGAGGRCKTTTNSQPFSGAAPHADSAPSGFNLGWVGVCESPALPCSETWAENQSHSVVPRWISTPHFRTTLT